jgi:16S rRNA (cytosine1402-N4)-methyltransferase
MTAGGGAPSSGGACGPSRHIPVLRREALDALGLKPGGRYVDGTFGAGGYTRAILEAFPDTRVLAIDRDPDAVVAGRELAKRYGGRLTMAEGRFGDLDALVAEAGFGTPDGVVLDIGVSSMQLDEAMRGFSFRNDGPLDMRMERAGRSAADIVNEAGETELANIIYHFGEERLSRPIARALVAAREAQPFTTTRQLAEAVARVVRSKPGDIHPATRTFQALRIAVNDELGELVRALHAAERALAEGGRLAVVSFHSLEDRIVKVFLAARSGKGGGSRHAPIAVASPPTFRIEGKQPLAPGEGETAANPRARSAKLRAAIRTNSPARSTEASVAALAVLPPVSRNGRR